MLDVISVRKKGHYKNMYPLRKGKKFDEHRSDTDNESSLVSDGYESSKILVVNSIRLEMDWVLESSYSFHLTPFRHSFSDLKKVDSGRVLLVDEHKCKIKGVGLMKLSLLDETVRVLNYVRLVPELKKNLISLGTLDATEYLVKISNQIMKLMKGFLVVFREIRVSGSYSLQGSTLYLSGKASVAQSLDIASFGIRD